jgi:helix-turn-helix protein
MLPHPKHFFLLDKKFMGRFLVIAETCIDEMAFYILSESDNVVICKNLWNIPDDDLEKPGAQSKVLEMEHMPRECFSDTMSTFAALLSENDVLNSQLSTVQMMYQTRDEEPDDSSV